MPRNRKLRWLITATALIVLVGLFTAWQLWPTTSVDPRPLPAQSVAYAQKKKKQLYTCGMHPNVVQEGPGSCPICGMNLTPMKVGTAGGKTKKKKGKRKIKYWRAPMNPSYIRDKPGKSPMGMDLVPVYEGDPVSGATVAVDPVMVQNMGVRVDVVKRGSLARSVRTIGEVVVAENLVSVVNLKFSGWIEKLYVDETGIRVRRGQALFRVYSPELVSAQEEYLLALRTAGKASPLARSARTRLKLWDLSDRAIARIAARGKPMRTLTITAPRSGYVLHKNVVQGARALAGQDIFRIGRLDAIWVHVQVYEFDAPWIKLGQPATMELSFQRGRLFNGKVSYVYPTLSPRTRTLTVRLEFKNPELGLKPGMFTTVRIKTRKMENVVLVPTEAILHSGERQIVFVTEEIGKYQPREIVTGLSGDGHLTEVISGLKAGEQIVLSGQFLLDSESQLQEAVQKLLASRLQSKQGQKKPASGAKSEDAGHEGHARSEKPPKDKADKTIWTCSMHPQIQEPKPGKCPICGMTLIKKKGK